MNVSSFNLWGRIFVPVTKEVAKTVVTQLRPPSGQPRLLCKAMVEPQEEDQRARVPPVPGPRSGSGLLDSVSWSPEWGTHSGGKQLCCKEHGGAGKAGPRGP